MSLIVNATEYYKIAMYYNNIIIGYNISNASSVIQKVDIWFTDEIWNYSEGCKLKWQINIAYFLNTYIE